MKLFHRIYVQVFVGMTALAAGILFFLLTAMFRQSLSDARKYGTEAFRNKVSVLRDYVQQETAGHVHKVVVDAVLVSGFSELFEAQGVLWREGEEVRNTSPYVFEQHLLKEMSGKSGQSGIWVSAPQNVGGRRLLIFYQDSVPVGADGYSIAVYQDVTDILIWTGKLFVWGMGFCVALLGLVGAAVYRRIRCLLSPLEELKCAAVRIAQGNYDTSVTILQNNEIGELTECFNRMVAEIRRHMEVFTEMNRQQKQLLGGLAHEMRTPLTAVIANADMLLTLRIAQKERDRALLFVLEEAKRLTRLSEKMQELTGLCEPMAIPLELRETPIQMILDRIADLTIVERTQKELHLEMCCVPAGLTKELDMDLMVSLVLNLTENACRASEKGGRILIAVSGQELVVEDFGKGIPAAEIKRVTEAFYRVDKSRSGRAGGVGLGLALCQRIVQMHGWTLRIESTEGKGTKVLILW